MNNPTIVCLCGSTRFKDAFLEAARKETLAGKIVLSVGCFTHADDGGDAEVILGKEIKAMLDALHFKKIEMADEVLVLNVGGYIGESTAREIFHALENGKPVRLLEPHLLAEAKRRLNRMLQAREKR